MKKPVTSGLIRLQRVMESKREDARLLRKNMTEAETVLWQELRGRRLCGFKFRRQQVIDGFIVDFYCEQAKLVVEVDGGIHDKEPQKELDEHRTRVFSARGLQTIRFKNEEVFNNLRLVLEKIRHHLVPSFVFHQGEGIKEYPSFPSHQGEGIKG